MLQFVDRWFEPIQARSMYRQHQYPLLLILIAAGTLLRFWTLGNVGLHGDEDIMGLAARGIVEKGIPTLPSGLVYLRAPLQTYLQAGSILIFGDSEWALRLPSAVIGSLCGMFAFLLGRRFLGVHLNLAFVAIIMFLPVMIEISQTARMYVFLVASLLIFALWLFRWEETGRRSEFAIAIGLLLIAIQFHQLAVFAAPMLLYPGLANKSWKQMLTGSIGIALTVCFSELFGLFVHREYPESTERLTVSVQEAASPIETLASGHLGLAIVVALGVAISVFAVAAFRPSMGKNTLPPACLLSGGSVACVLLQYHIGLLLLLCGAIAWSRLANGSKARLWWIAAIIAAIGVVQLQVLGDSGNFPGRSIVGALVGLPSIWPTLKFLTFSPVASAAQVMAIGLALWRFARGDKVPINFLLFFIAVWAPLFIIGFFSWYPADRYLLTPLPVFLLLSLSGVAYLTHALSSRGKWQGGTLACVATVFLTVLIIGPAQAWRVSRNSYESYPDHNGAADFLKQLGVGPGDLVIAEDCIVHTYYLGRVDYRLQNYSNSRKHSILRGGVLYGQYTDAPVIGSGSQLKELLDESHVGELYIVSSGEGAPDWQRRNRENGIAEVLRDDRLQQIFLGRDGETRIWRLRR